MDTGRDKPTGTDGNPYIWLRYTTQFSAGGRTHTIEMGIPVPLGASTEMREQLIREAEIGMDQLSRRVENRVSQILQRNSRPSETARAQESSAAKSAQAPLQDSSRGTTTTGSAPAREGPQPLPLQEKQAATTPIRQSVGASMPLTPGMLSDASGNMNLGQFIRVIKDAWGLSPKQAMDLLNVKTLNGMNYRELLRQLQPLVEGDARNTSMPGPAKNSPVISQPKPAEERGRPQGSPPNPAPPTPLRANTGSTGSTGTTGSTGSTGSQGSQLNTPDQKTVKAHSTQSTPPPAPTASSKPPSPSSPARPAPGPLPGPSNIPV